MKLLSIRLNNVRRFTQPVEITGIGPGLNVLAAPNEFGKSTLFDALHALFFYPAKSWRQNEAAALAPHAGGTPEISADIDVDGTTFTIAKTFTKASGKGDVTVHKSGHLFKQADEAEAWISALIKSPKDGGPAGLLWVRQGLTTLHAAKDDDTLTARRDLLSSVAGEIEDVTGGRQMEAIRATLQTDLDTYITKTGKPKANGPLERAQQTITDLTEECDTLSAQVASLRSKLHDRRTLTGEKANLTAPETVEKQQQDLHTAQNTLETAQAHQGKLDTAQAALNTAQQAYDSHQDRVTTLQDRLKEWDTASAEQAKANQTVQDQKGTLADAEDALTTAKVKDLAARTAQKHARATFDAVLEQTANQQGLKRRKELTKRLEDAETLTAQFATAQKAIEPAPTPSAIAALEQAWQTLDLLDRAHKASAAAVTVQRDAGQTACITLNETPLPDNTRTALPDGGDIAIGGFGTLRIHPADLGDDAQRTDAQAKFDAALAATGHPTLTAARDAARHRADDVETLNTAKARLKIAAPDGIDALLGELATLPEQATQAADLPTQDAAQQAAALAQTALDAAQTQYEGARAARDTLKTTALVAQEKLDNAQQRCDRARAALDDPDTAKDRLTQLRDLGPTLRQNRDDAKTALDTLSQNAPDLDLATAGAKRAEDVIEQSRTRLQDINIHLAQLEGAIKHEADLAVEEKLAEAEDRLTSAQDLHANITQEVRVLQRLDAALKAAQSQAHDAYIGPILTELRPLLRMVLPGADLKLDAESVLPTGLIRAEGEDSYDQLSGGTQEQIALLVRLAFARLLAKAGTPAPVILDDAIVYTDDDRIERMFNALTQQAGDLQIIVLSCRQRVFRGLGGQTLSIQQATTTPEGQP